MRAERFFEFFALLKHNFQKYHKNPAQISPTIARNIDKSILAW